MYTVPKEVAVSSLAGSPFTEWKYWLLVSVRPLATLKLDYSDFSPSLSALSLLFYVSLYHLIDPRLGLMLGSFVVYGLKDKKQRNPTSIDTLLNLHRVTSSKQIFYSL